MSAAAAIQPAAVLTAGTYLRLRREAAVVSIEQAARAYAHSPLGMRAAELLLEESERDVTQLGEASLRRLQTAFAFDATLYLALAEGMPVRPICRCCGCSDWDPCATAERGVGCAWADEARTLCSVCKDKGCRHD